MLIVAASPPKTFSDSGISRNLRLTFLKHLPLGTDVRAICEMINIRKRIGLVKTELINVEMGEIRVKGEHQKANMDCE